MMSVAERRVHAAVRGSGLPATVGRLGRGRRAMATWLLRSEYSTVRFVRYSRWCVLCTVRYLSL